MSTRSSLILGTSMVLCCLTLAAGFGPFSVAQQVQPGQPAVGRYQLQVADQTGAFLLDTTTGQCWGIGASGEWKDLQSPPTAPKEKKANGERLEIHPRKTNEAQPER
jgi:hypothetical protein